MWIYRTVLHSKSYVLKFPFLFRSESPSQAFLILVLWLYRKFKPLLDDGMAPEELLTVMSSSIVAYDNMCRVHGLKVARVDLPFEDPWKKVWQCVVKVIDKLHILNHKDEKCKTMYKPIDKVPSGYNIMAAEQTFVWGSRFKRLICAMPQLHQFFYLHRLVKQRNAYTQHCHQSNKIPVLPKESTTTNSYATIHHYKGIH